jgi:hypothetical protein
VDVAIGTLMGLGDVVDVPHAETRIAVVAIPKSENPKPFMCL